MFEDWSTNNPDNFGIGEDCTHIFNTGCGENFQPWCRWNDAPCTFTSILHHDPSLSGGVLRPICKQEQTVCVFEAKTL